MQTLIVIDGTRSVTYELGAHPLSVGAGGDVDVVVTADPEVAPRHCLIEPLGPKRWKLRAAGSSHATFLNDSPVSEAELTSGDRIRVGQTVLLYFDRDAAKDNSAQRRLQNLLLLQEINKQLNSETDLDRLLELIMDMAIQLTQAERGFLILIQGDNLSFKVARNIDAKVVKSPEFKISNSVIRRVVKTGEPILTSNAQADLASFQSIVNQDVRSLLCVPLRKKARLIGTLYVDSRRRAASFTEHDKELLSAFSDQAAIAIENARLLKEATAAEAIRSELRVAARIQGALLPRKEPTLPGLEVAGAMIAAKEVGGDYYDYIMAPPDPKDPSRQDLFLAIGDVSGKGVPAGLVMVMARSVLRSLASSWDAVPVELVTEVNRIIKPDLKPGMFMSMLLSRYDASSGLLRLCGAGHERPLVFRMEGRNVQAFDAGGIVLGVVPDISRMVHDLEIELAVGDQILFYTDGVTEAMNAQGEQYGLQRLMAMLSRTGHQPPRRLVTQLLADIESHRGATEQNDDITIIALRRSA